jgi:RNA polymerase primary sigma factor
MKSLKITAELTNRNSKAFNKYLNEISTIKPFTVDEEALCATRAYNGDEKAITELVKRNLRFVVSVAKQYLATNTVLLEDIVNEGNIGLMMAARRFKPDKGYKFISYGVWWIRKYIMEYLTNHGRLVRIPSFRLIEATKHNETLSKLDDLINKNINNLNNNIVNEVIKDEEIFNEDFNQINHVSNYKCISFDSNIKLSNNDTSEQTLVETMNNIDFYTQTDYDLLENDKSIYIDKCINKLSPRERYIITEFFGLNNKQPKSVNEISSEIGYSRELVRKTKHIAMVKLKGILDKELFYS